MNMKRYYKTLLAITLLLTGCTKNFLDINKDPNNPTKAPLSQLLSSVEVNLGTSLSIRYGLSNFAAVYMHQITMREDPDQYGVTGSSFYTNNPWYNIYTGPLQDIDLMIRNADASGDLQYAGIARILKAYAFSELVDVYADVPFSEANQQPEGINYPKYDRGADIYPQLLALLDKGIENINDASAKNLFVPGDDDFIYNGDVDKWIRAANTIKLKLYNQVRLVQDVTADVNALITENNLIGSGEDFEIPYGTSKSPDERNPGVLEYEAGQKGFYISPWFYQLLSGYNPALFTGITDPRIPYYFYNQLAPGDATREGNPTEYRDGGFVSIYFGSIGPNRDHSTDGSMTVLGMYPVGGRFDEGDATKVTGTSCTGAAPYRLITYADRLYIQAELVNVGLVAGDARALLDSAMIASFKLVDHVVELTQTTQSVPVLDGSAEVTSYINSILSSYDAGTNDKKLEIIMTQKWISSFGSNVDQWTDYRRTGYPIVFDPNDPTQAPGGFVTSPDGPTVGAPPIPIPVQRTNAIPLSLPWSQDDLSINANAPTQKNPATFKVFWDN
jgi:hypothetical protein